MKLEQRMGIQAERKAAWARSLSRAGVVVLLLTVAGLSAAAKDGKYYPRSNPARYVSLSTEMNAAAVPVVFDREPQPIAMTFVPPHPVLPMVHREEPADPLITRIGLTVSMRHRSPPVFPA